ncbi:MAG: SDR family NAD(P)-dependent oxidoreductase [Polyangiaceae bacterium]
MNDATGSRADQHHHEIVIIGAGPSGVGAAIRLLERGHPDFVVLEKAADVGGTWRDNTYPGCACDVPSALYSYSFAPNPDWSRAFAEQPEIRRYIERTADERGVRPHLRTGTEVRRATFREADRLWELETSRGTYTCRFLIGASGPWHQPRMPEVEGLERFRGPAFHSARWDHSVELEGKRVAVIGTGASAIQFIPKIQPKARALHVYQRTATWVLPKPDHRVPAIERALFRALPIAQEALRRAEFSLLDATNVGFRRPALLRALERIGRFELRRKVPDPARRALLTPSFTLGCKRVLLSNDYYPAMSRPNVELHPTAVRAIHERGVEDASGAITEVDAIIFGTGFHITDPPIAGLVVGRGARSLADVWRGSPEAYRGTTVSGFPNFFLLLGPNLGTGHSSAFSILEAQIEYVLGALDHARREKLESLEVRADVQAAYNAEIQAALAGTVYNAGGCSSYYIDRNGRNSFSWPWTTARMIESLRTFVAKDYVAEASASEGPVVAITGAARGIGLATAKAFLREGARVALGDIDASEVARVAHELGDRALAHPLDVTSKESFTAFLRATERRFGPIDVLVNNAGLMPLGAFVDEADAVSRTTLDVNVWGVLLGMRLALPAMIERGAGHVVNVASMAGKFPIPGAAAYCASKFAVIGLGAAVRQELEGTGVTISTVLPSAVRTGLVSGVPLGTGLPIVEPEAIAEAVVKSCATKRAEIPVPGWMAGYDALMAVTPAPVVSRVLRALDSKRVLTRLDGEARAGYDAMIRAQADARS